MALIAPPRALVAAVVALVISIFFAMPAWATFTVIDLHPAGAISSVANGIRNGQKVGRVNGNASIWNGANVVNTSIGSGQLYATDGVEQVGYVGGPRAFYGTPGSAIDLTPVPAPSSYIDAVPMGVFAGLQVGYILTSVPTVTFKATLWGDSGTGYIDLNPAIPLCQSIAYGEYNGQEVGGFIHPGLIDTHAIVWFGNNTNYTDINPAGATRSEAFAVYAGRQGGYATFAGVRHAGTWNNTAASFTDLHPAGADESTVGAVDNGAGTNTQAGYAVFAGVDHAAYWAGSAGSFEDLHSYLPAGFTSSRATGIWVNNQGLAMISGWAYNANGQPEAKLWVQSVPEPTTATLFFAAPLLFLTRRKR